MKQRFSNIVLTAALLSSLPLHGQVEQPLDSVLARRIDSLLQHEAGRQDIIGMSVGIVYQGKIAFLKGYGYSDWEKRIPVTLESEFRWASMSKSLTSVAALKLQEQGMLNLDTTAKAYVPAWPDSTVRVRQLLENRSGIGHYREMDQLFPDWKKNLKQRYPKDTTWRADEAVEVFKDAPLAFRPDSGYMYTTFGFVLAGAVLDKIGKINFGVGYLGLVDKFIVQPLEMRSLKPDFEWGDNPYEVKGYYRDRRGDIRVRKDDDVSWKVPGGGYQSNIIDLTKYVKSLITRELLDPGSYERLWMRQPDWDYGMGFEVRGQGPDLRVAHSGSQTKTRTIFVCYPNRQTGIAVMCNTEWANPSEVAERLLKLMLSYTPPAVSGRK